MRNFIIGVLAGITIAVCGYTPYQIEAKYLRNIAAGLSGLGFQSSPHCMITVFKPSLLLQGETVELSKDAGNPNR